MMHDVLWEWHSLTQSNQKFTSACQIVLSRWIWVNKTSVQICSLTQHFGYNTSCLECLNHFISIRTREFFKLCLLFWFSHITLHNFYEYIQYTCFCCIVASLLIKNKTMAHISNGLFNKIIWAWISKPAASVNVMKFLSSMLHC